MDTVNIVLCGLGGQGILFMTKIMSKASLEKGYDLMSAETHGMAQRGGSVISHLRVGSVAGSLVRTGSAHILLALDENEGYRNLPFLSPGAVVFANADSEKFPRNDVKSFFEQQQITFHTVSAGPIALELGAPMSTNLALLGFFAAFDQGPVNKTEMRKTVEAVSPDRFREINLKVFDAGLEMGK